MAWTNVSFNVATGGGCNCCGGTPAECACALLVPPFLSPYASYSDAQNVVDQTATSEWTDCYGYILVAGSGTVGSFSSNASVSNELTLDGTSSDTDSLEMWGSITVDASAVIAVAFTVNGVLLVVAEAHLYDCNGTLIESLSDNANTGTLTFAAVAAGTYYVKVVGSNAVLPEDATFIISSTTLVPNPAIALWDDSGTTRQLEACPKFLLPPLTENTSDWYANSSAANAVLSDPLQVSNCVGFTDYGPLDSFTATDGGSSLGFSADAPSAPPGFAYFYGSVNAVGGQTLTFTSGGGFPDIGADIYDSTGALIQSIAVGASPRTSSALPYTGRYLFKIEISGAPGSATGAATVTSSGAMSVNPIQALFDTGLTCPSRTDC